MVERRNWYVWRYMGLGWGGAAALLYAPRLVFGPLTPAEIGTSRVLIPTLATAVAIAWAFWMAALAFRRLDEFQKEGSKFAWYWGGTLGLAVSVAGYSFIGLGGLHWLDPAHFGVGRELFRAFQIGYALGIGCPFLGFLLTALWWQAAKR